MSEGPHSRTRAAELKFARDPSSPSAQREGGPGNLELIAVGHIAIFVIATTWAFGGQADWLVAPLAGWGSLAVLISAAALRRGGSSRPLAWLLPLVAFNAIALVAAANPNLREIRVGNEILLAKAAPRAFLPSSARPTDALRGLWLFDTIYLSCFNLVLVVRRRRALRLLLLLAVTNAAVLAVFGTAQKIAHAPGLFFGTVPSPQTQFFASFVYHNHWGAFILLMISACLALIWHYGRRREARNFFHTPATGGIVVVLLLAATLPLSTSRSSTILGILLLGGAFVHALVRLARHRRRLNESVAVPVVGAFAGLLLALAAVVFIARDSIATRVAKTQEQLAEIRERGGLGQRSELYRNTWRMAKDKLWFGWGLASYPHVFTLYNTERSPDKLPRFYHDAHSDWLQAFAEHGVIGAGLLGLCGIVPLLSLRRRDLGSPVPAYLLTGCALLLAYAWVEFPFGNVAVVLTWWLCFFSAVQFARLNGHENRDPGRRFDSSSGNAAGSSA